MCLTYYLPPNTPLIDVRTVANIANHTYKVWTSKRKERQVCLTVSTFLLSIISTVAGRLWSGDWAQSKGSGTLGEEGFYTEGDSLRTAPWWMGKSLQGPVKWGGQAACWLALSRLTASRSHPGCMCSVYVTILTCVSFYWVKQWPSGSAGKKLVGEKFWPQASRVSQSEFWDRGWGWGCECEGRGTRWRGIWACSCFLGHSQELWPEAQMSQNGPGYHSCSLCPRGCARAKCS